MENRKESDSEPEEEMEKVLKKVVHFDQHHAGHIELKDLTEHDFEDLIADKNQDKRFYGWLHFAPICELKEKITDPVEDIEYFRWLYDNDIFSSHDVTMEDEDIKRDRNFSMDAAGNWTKIKDD